MSLKRNGVFRSLGVVPKNPRWSWCAINANKDLAVFTLWEDEEKDGGIWFLHDDNENRSSPGYSNQKEILNFTIDKNISALGILCTAKDIEVSPRSIKSVNEKELFKLKVYKNSQGIYAKKVGQISRDKQIELIQKEKKNDALMDLDFIPLGSENPDRALGLGFTIKRDLAVRKFVIDKANGLCEYCGMDSFKMRGGKNYLEAHHIIHLAHKGKDTVDNVIALCPNHHREAHYGINAEELEKVFIQKVMERNVVL